MSGQSASDPAATCGWMPADASTPRARASPIDARDDSRSYPGARTRSTPAPRAAARTSAASAANAPAWRWQCESINRKRDSDHPPKGGRSVASAQQRPAGRCGGRSRGWQAFVETELGALGVGDDRVPALARDLRPLCHHAATEAGHARQDGIDRVGLDVHACLVADRIAALTYRAADCLGLARVEHEVPVEAGNLAELPPEQLVV